jgi:hypothetical protein
VGRRNASRLSGRASGTFEALENVDPSLLKLAVMKSSESAKSGK